MFFKRVIPLFSALALLVLAVIRPPAYAAVTGYERLDVVDGMYVDRAQAAADRFATDVLAIHRAIERSAAVLPQGDEQLAPLASRPLAPCPDVCTILRAMPAPQHAQGRPQLQLHHLNL